MNFRQKILLLFFLMAGSLLQAQSYKKLHKKSLVVDTHNDVISSVVMRGLHIEDDLTGKTHSDLTRFKKGGIDVQVFSIWCDEHFGRDTAFKYANIEIDSLYSIAERNPDRLLIVRTPDELKSCVKNHKLAAMIGVEGGHMIEDNIMYLDSLFSRGARYMTLTWNNSTSWASSAKDETSDSAKILKKGLNEFGEKVVKRMNELGMMVDLSHVGEQTFWDAIHLATKPVIASHSCTYALCPVFRNLKDEQIMAIGKNGGLISLNFFSGFVDSSFSRKEKKFMAEHKAEIDSLSQLKWNDLKITIWMSSKYPGILEEMRPPLSLLMDHLDYIVRLIGVDHVGLGSDFDGIQSSPQQLNGVQDMPIITKELRARGYNKNEIRKILGGNFLRVFQANIRSQESPGRPEDRNL